MNHRRTDCDEDWADIAAQWDIRPDTTYLNHGSFGPSPRRVRERRRQVIDQADCQPMDFFVRHGERLVEEARQRLAEFLGTSASQLVLVDNATYAMNVVANSFPLAPGDEVIINDHEYGAVRRIWQRTCGRAGARCVEVALPTSFESDAAVVDALVSRISPRTRLLVVSHITSPTALILPVREICRAARERNVAVCIDGPHALVQLDMDLDSLGCDFYTASCHKWLCAPLGTGMLHVHPRWDDNVVPPILSWGRLLPAIPERWDEQFTWIGTRDLSTLASIPAAIDFLTEVGIENFRRRSFWLAQEATRELVELTGQPPLGHDVRHWYGSMAHVPLPPGDWSQLQSQLWEQHRIEVPVICHNERWFIRVSCHLYTTTGHLDRLIGALQGLLHPAAA